MIRRGKTRRWLVRCLWLGGLAAAGLLGTGCETTSRSRNPETVFRPVSAKAPNAMDKSGVMRVGAIEKVETPSAPNIDLANALELARIGNPTVNLAREATREAEAQLLAANALKLPSLNAGFNFNLHRGSLQRAPGPIVDVNRQSLEFGAGTMAIGAGTTVIPGVRLIYPLADIVSEPRAAQQRLASRRADAAGTQNATLLDVATAYLELLRAEAILEELKRSEGDVDEVVRLTKAFAKGGQGRDADSNRATANAELLKRLREEAFGERIAASARLAGILSLDPTAPLVTPGGRVYPLKLIDAEPNAEALVAQAVANRPELAARLHDVEEARSRVRQEQVRPWLPTISAGYSYGVFGGGGNQTVSEFDRFAGRSDFDISAVWSLQNLGFGNRAATNRNRAVSMQALARFEETRNRIRAEVEEAQAQIRAAATQIDTARRQLATAEEGYREESKRIQQAEGLPLELLDSSRSLLDSRLELVRAITEYNLAQFRLLAAVGTSPDSVPLPAK